MNNEEKYIQEKLGQRNPFRVPEGYFDQLAEQVMARLPEQKVVQLPEQGAEESKPVVVELPKRRAKSKVVALRPWLYAAASVVIVVVMSLSFYFHRNAGAELQTATATTVSTTDDSSYIDEAVDYAMLDNVEIYALLAEN